MTCTHEGVGSRGKTSPQDGLGGRILSAFAAPTPHPPRQPLRTPERASFPLALLRVYKLVAARWGCGFAPVFYSFPLLWDTPGRARKVLDDTPGCADQFHSNFDSYFDTLGGWLNIQRCRSRRVIGNRRLGCAVGFIHQRPIPLTPPGASGFPRFSQACLSTLRVAFLSRMTQLWSMR